VRRGVVVKSVSFDSEYFGKNRPEMVSYVPPDAQLILDVGCPSGGFGQLLMARNPKARVIGIEMVEPAARKASGALTEVYVGTMQEHYAAIIAKYGRFDVVTMNDVLEHIADTEEALEIVRALLKPDGCFVISVPNVRYYPVLKQLMVDGDWRYQDSGVLDRTHLRFFTRKSIVRALEQSGLQVRRMEGINPMRLRLQHKLLSVLSAGRIKECWNQQIAVVASTPA
jgi:2-polyprenyl-3-methyl-5-hydroxy-6-metoxy-1,4-benzoquinol methylase